MFPIRIQNLNISIRLFKFSPNNIFGGCTPFFWPPSLSEIGQLVTWVKNYR